MLGKPLGNYRVVEKLGEGGMGVVYVGRHETLGHRVVVKVLRTEMSRNADMVRRFFNEAQAATAIRNPGIVQVFDFGTTSNGRAYFVMELLEGQDLGARLKQRRLDTVECCRIARQIANVLQSAHEAGITHRDLKPDNLFLVPDPEVIGGERVKVLDFGIAKLARELHDAGVQTRADLVMGTPSYMSPEQCRGAGAVDTRTDIYSLGCILFKMVSGRAPFLGHGAGDIIGAHLHVPPPDLQSLAPDAPSALAALVAKMLEKKPDARPQTMGAVSQALDELLHALTDASAATPLPGPPPSSSARGARALPGLPPISTDRGPPPPPGISLIETSPVPLQTATSPASSLVTTLPVSTPGPDPGRNTPPPPTSPFAETVPVPVFSPAPPPRRDATPLPAPTPTPPSMPQLSSTSTTLGGAAGVSSVQESPRRRRLSLLLGGAAIAGAAVAVVIVLAGGGSSSPGKQVSYDEIGAAPPAADAAVVEDAAAAPPPIADEDAQETAAPADDLESECRGFQVDRKWGELEQCAGRLAATDPKRAAEYRDRALKEAETAPRIAAVETALRQKNLKRAKTELDEVWTDSLEHDKIKRKYDAAEAKATADLAEQLELAADADCKQHTALLAKARTINPPRVTDGAARRAPCTPLSTSRCDAAALAEKARVLQTEGKSVAALKQYELAWSCKPNSNVAQRALLLACNIPSVQRAKVFWKRLPAADRKSLPPACANNQITLEELNAP